MFTEAAAMDLKKCPHCKITVRADRLADHVDKRCPAAPRPATALSQSAKNPRAPRLEKVACPHDRTDVRANPLAEHVGKRVLSAVKASARAMVPPQDVKKSSQPEKVTCPHCGTKLRAGQL